MDKMKQPGLILKSAIAVRSNKKMPRKCRIPCFPAVRDTQTCRSIDICMSSVCVAQISYVALENMSQMPLFDHC